MILANGWPAHALLAAGGMLGVWAASLTLVGLAGALIDSHRRAWRRFDAGAEADLPAEDPRARAFAAAQFRRRMLASSTVAAVGMLIAVRPIVPWRPAWQVVHLALMVGGCLLVVALGLLDALATSRYDRRVRRGHRPSEEQLAEALEAARNAKPEA